MSDATDLGPLTEALGGDGALLGSLLEHVPVGVVVAKAPDGPILFRNAEAERILPFDQTRRPEVGFVPYVAYHPDGRHYDAEEWPVVRAMRDGSVIDHETMEVEFSDGARRIVVVNAAPVREPTGRIIAAVVFFTDVTDRARRERAEREFITNAAHELQTPIAAIVSAIDVLQAGAKHRAVDRNRFIAHIENAAARLDRLTRALLVLARAETAQELARREIVPLAPLLRSVAAGGGSRDRIVVRCPPDLATVANRELLEQTLVNLVANALRHGDGNPVAVAARRTAWDIVVEVRDEGPGIPEAERDLVFKRFYRGNSGGFGIGLSIVRESVRAMGGTVELDSSDAGTVVSVRLPAARIIKQ